MSLQDDIFDLQADLEEMVAKAQHQLRPLKATHPIMERFERIVVALSEFEEQAEKYQKIKTSSVQILKLITEP